MIFRDSDQFELDLFPGAPWGGRSPRGLTWARKALFLRRKPPGHEVDVDPAQLLLWPVAEKATVRKRRRAESFAPPLLPLKGRRLWPAPRKPKWGD